MPTRSDGGRDCVLSVQGLTKRFGGFTAVRNLSFELAEGEILGLIGPNGSGKSTTFNVIAGLFAPTEGSVRLDGREIGGLPPYRICQRGLARTFQIPRPFRKLSILENTVLAAHYGGAERIDAAEARKRANDALELVGLPRERAARVGGPAGGPAPRPPSSPRRTAGATASTRPRPASARTTRSSWWACPAILRRAWTAWARRA